MSDKEIRTEEQPEEMVALSRLREVQNKMHDLEGDLEHEKQKVRDITHEYEGFKRGVAHVIEYINLLQHV